MVPVISVFWAQTGEKQQLIDHKCLLTLHFHGIDVLFLAGYAVSEHHH